MFLTLRAFNAGAQRVFERVDIGERAAYNVPEENHAVLTIRTKVFAILLCSVLGGISFMNARGENKSRVFELRTYTTFEGKLPDLQKRFREHTIEIFNRHHMTSIGYWIPRDAPLSQNTLIYVLAHPSLEDAKKNWDAFRNDPEWKQVSQASEANGKIVTHVTSVFMDPADYSPVK